MDLSKLTAAPWAVTFGTQIDGPKVDGRSSMTIYDEGGHSETDAAFIALARNAFDVMMRRGWTWLYRDDLGIEPIDAHTGNVIDGLPDRSWGDDSFTALVEADRWYKENVEKNP